MEPARHPDDEVDEPLRPPMTGGTKRVIAAVLVLVAAVVVLHLSGVIGGAQIGH